MTRYCIKVQENNIIKITPKLPEQLADKILTINGVNFIEYPSIGNYSNVIIDLDFKNKVKLALNVLLT